MTGRTIKKPHISRCKLKSNRWSCVGSGISGYGNSKREAYEEWLRRLTGDDAMHPLDRAHEAELLAMTYFDHGFLALAATLKGLAKVIRYQHNVITGSP